MATENHSAALRAPASSHPMAKPGYGKRSTPGQAPSRAGDFMLLPERERYIAAFVDRLPDGAAMNVKTLAKQLPRYGQQAVSTALTALSVAGHLRRVRRLVGEGDRVRWVFRTFWSRTARDNEWWAAHLAAEDVRGAEAVCEAAPQPPWVPAEVPARSAEDVRQTPPQALEQNPAPAPAPASTPTPAPQPVPNPVCPSPAYLALAQLGRIEPRLALSAADCEALEAQAAEWLARGVNTDYVIQALTSGLPESVDAPRGFVRRRLLDKMPPRLPAATPVVRTTGVGRAMMECTQCGVPGRPEALPDGLCRACRPASPSSGPSTDGVTEAIATRDVHALVGQLRDLTRLP